MYPSKATRADPRVVIPPAVNPCVPMGSCVPVLQVQKPHDQVLAVVMEQQMMPPVVRDDTQQVPVGDPASAGVDMVHEMQIHFEPPIFRFSRPVSF